MIEVLESQEVLDPETSVPLSRAVRIVITQAGKSYDFHVGGLPLSGNLQTILDAREPELWLAAVQRGKVHDLFFSRQERIIKALALVVLDELNLLRANAGMAARNQTQIETAIRNKIKVL